MQGLTWTSCAVACLPKRDRGICERRAARLDLSLNTDGRRCRPGRAGQEAERQKRDDDLQLIELGNSGFMGRPLHLITLWNDGDSRSEHLVLCGFGKQPEM
jgi:hypothetical protein